MISSFFSILIISATVTCSEKFVINLTISENRAGSEEIINLRTHLLQNKLNIKSTGSFEIISNEPEIGNYFVLDSRTGQLKLRTHIDRETICKHTDLCRMTILVSVDGNVLEVIIDVLDVNDNSPQFAMRYKILTVQENVNIGVELSLPTAEDADSSEFGINRYYIEDSQTISSEKKARYRATNYFRILEKTINNVKIPYLATIKEIDREEVDQFELLLVAEDKGKQKGSCTLTINVSDVNDNSPQWPTVSIHKKVRECDQQGTLLELQAYDRDDVATPNGQIKYKISDNSPKMEIINRIFYIAGSSLFLSSHSLQSPEIGNKLVFFITAIDGGGRENDTSVTVEIEDCNNHAPNIQLTKNSATVTENDKSLKPLTTVTVKDDDRETNSDFNCELNDTTFMSLSKRHSFRQPNGGQLIIYELEKSSDVMFDREKLAYYSVVIRCIDQGRPSLTGEKMFSVSILDQNDNAPKFPNKEIQFSITENNDIGAVIGYVKATDLDSIENGRISYRIVNQEENLYFTITSYGKIETKWKFDRELKSSYSLTVIARDNGSPSLNDTCDIKITILDVNDCSPTFKQQYFYQITESLGLATMHAKLGKMVAEDQDLGENGSIQYAIKHNNFGYKRNDKNAGLLLKIDNDGILTIYGVVDREKMVSIEAEVVASDNGRPRLSSSTTVTVDVLDLNDNKPKFKYPMAKINYINVSTDTAVGTVLVSVEAEDPDKGENGTISYSIVGQKMQQEPFQLQHDGRLILIQSLKDRDPASRLPDRLLIKASDGGSPPLLELLTLHIKYIVNEQRSKDHSWSFNDRKQVEKNRVPDGYRENESTDNMILLYVLAGVLFTVFLIVLLVLMYTYFSGRFVRERHHNSFYEKQLNNICPDGPGSYECELLTAGSQADGRDDFAKVSTISMAFPSGEKGNYTHLVMNDSKYTPIQITPNYFHTMNSSTPMSQQTDMAQSNLARNYGICDQPRFGTCAKKTNRLSSKWNSIENISQTNDTTLGPSQHNQNHSFLYNAHSYAAYINQFGRKDDAEHGVRVDENANSARAEPQTMPHSSAKLSKDDQTYEPVSSTKKCYVTSSFV